MKDLFVVLIVLAVKDAASLGSPPHDVGQALCRLDLPGACKVNQWMVGHLEHSPWNEARSIDCSEANAS